MKVSRKRTPQALKPYAVDADALSRWFKDISPEIAKRFVRRPPQHPSLPDAVRINQPASNKEDTP
jgi:hypothetical protein